MCNFKSRVIAKLDVILKGITRILEKEDKMSTTLADLSSAFDDLTTSVSDNNTEMEDLVQKALQARPDDDAQIKAITDRVKALTESNKKALADTKAVFAPPLDGGGDPMGGGMQGGAAGGETTGTSFTPTTSADASTSGDGVTQVKPADPAPGAPLAPAPEGAGEASEIKGDPQESDESKAS